MSCRRNSGVSRRYYLSSALLSATQFAHAAKAHRGVESRLHWPLDVDFRGDSCACEPKTAPPTWPALNTPLSTSSRKSPIRPASKSERKPSHGTMIISSTPLLSLGGDLRAIPLAEARRICHVKRYCISVASVLFRSTISVVRADGVLDAPFISDFFAPSLFDRR